MAGHFPDFGLLPELVRGTEEMGWMLPTDIQAEAIPLILGGGDVLMAAETGSGKTGAFCLPVIQITHENLCDAKQGKLGGGGQSSTSGKWKMNVNDRDPSFAIAEDGYLCQAREERQWQGCRSTFGVTNGKFYYEATVTDEGLCRVGYSTDTATRDVGTDRESFGFGGTGKKSYAKQFDTYGEPFGINDTIGCYMDLDNYSIKFSKNGKDFGKAFDIPRSLHGSAFYASVTLKNAELRFNFGDSAFKNQPTDGYLALCKAQQGSLKKSSQVGATPVKFTNVCSPAAIIMEPSRELANQTLDQIKLFKKYLPDPSPNIRNTNSSRLSFTNVFTEGEKDVNNEFVRTVLLVGGQNARDQIMSLESGVDIVVGTPGKLEDFISTQKLKLDQVRFFILDEADGLLAQGQQELIMRIYNRCPKIAADGKRLQMVVCSATLHNFDVKRLAEKVMNFPTWIDLKGQDSVPDTVHHVVCHVDPSQDKSWHSLKHRVRTDGVHAEDKVHPSSSSPETLSEAVKILKAEYLFKAITEHKMYEEQAIIFCRTKLDCDNMERYLVEKGGGNPKTSKFACVCLHSDRAPKERQANLQAFKDKRAKFLICTDVAARGIDVKGIPFVINVTLPDDKANYIHRIGRVGRAERMGLAISLASIVKEKVWYHKCDSRGKNCYNTRLVEHGGCTIWYNEREYLGAIEEHLGETITAIERDIKVPVNEFDGKVVYGEKRRLKGAVGKYHTAELAPSVNDLASLEKRAQNSFLTFNANWMKASA